MKPEVEILIRTHRRPRCFARCIESIREAKKVFPGKIIVHALVDEPSTASYVKADKITTVVRLRTQYPPNDYFRQARSKMSKTAWLHVLDDDDLICGDYNLTVPHMDNPKNLILWKVSIQNGRKIVPSRIGHPPVRKDISGIGYMVHSSNWEAWPAVRAGDFCALSLLYPRSNPIWIDSVITKTQGEEGCAKGVDL